MCDELNRGVCVRDEAFLRDHSGGLQILRVRSDPVLV